MSVAVYVGFDSRGEGRGLPQPTPLSPASVKPPLDEAERCAARGKEELEVVYQEASPFLFVIKASHPVWATCGV